MKIRTGFVSNSSSSSFIVVFEKKPKNVKELQELLFGNRKEYHSHYDKGESWETKEIAKIVWKDLTGQKSLNMEKIQDVMDFGSPCIEEIIGIDTCLTPLILGMDQQSFESRITGEPDYFKMVTADYKNRELYEKQHEEYEKKHKEWINKKSNEYFKEHVDSKKFIAKFHYGDDDGSMYSAMEHGNLFEETLFKMRVSNH